MSLKESPGNSLLSSHSVDVDYKHERADLEIFAKCYFFHKHVCRPPLYRFLKSRDFFQSKVQNNASAASYSRPTCQNMSKTGKRKKLE
jgi:hypothetical protein